MILEVFIDFFWVKIAVGFNLCANLTVRSSLNCWDQSITVGSSQDFKFDNLDISNIADISSIYPDIFRYISDISRYISDILPKNQTKARVCHRPDISTIYRSKTVILAIIDDITNFLPIFPSNDYRLPISC